MVILTGTFLERGSILLMTSLLFSECHKCPWWSWFEAGKLTSLSHPPLRLVLLSPWPIPQASPLCLWALGRHTMTYAVSTHALWWAHSWRPKSCICVVHHHDKANQHYALRCLVLLFCSSNPNRPLHCTKQTQLNHAYRLPPSSIREKGRCWLSSQNGKEREIALSRIFFASSVNCWAKSKVPQLCFSFTMTQNLKLYKRDCLEFYPIKLSLEYFLVLTL